MRPVFVLPLSLLASLSLGQTTAADWASKSVEALGGRAALSRIGKTVIRSVGHTLHVEQSERPEGPYVTSYLERKEEADFDGQKLTGSVKMNGLIYGGQVMEFPLAFERGVAVGRALPGAAEDAIERVNLGPERVMLLALTAPDLHLGKRVNFQGVTHQELGFKWGSVPVKVLLNADTFFPAAVETVRQHQAFWATWGDVRSRTIWSNWELRPGGVWFPTQWDFEKNGIATGSQSLLEANLLPGSGVVQFETIKPAPIRSFLPAQYKQSELAPGITQWTGPYNTAVIEQEDGLVVLESVNSSKFASAFLDELAKQYPGKRVKAVVSTTDAWPHFGGMRTFAARGIQIVALDRNKPILSRFLAAPHTIDPDELQAKPAKGRFLWVSKPVSIGTGRNRLVVYPLGGEGSERMTMAYFPELKLLYGSDLLQPQGEEFFNPGYPAELRKAVERHGLAVDKVFAMHMELSPWTRVTTFLDKLKTAPASGGQEQ